MRVWLFAVAHIGFVVLSISFIKPVIDWARRFGYERYASELISRGITLLFLYALGWLLWYVFTRDADAEALKSGNSHEQLRLRDAQMNALYNTAQEQGVLTQKTAESLVGDPKRAKELLEVLTLEDRLVYDEKRHHFTVR